MTKVHARSQDLWELSLGSVRPMLFGASLKVDGTQRLKTPSHRPAGHVQARKNLQPGNDGPLKPG